jgi:hypothetical protein
MLAVAVLGTYLFLILAIRDRSIWLPIGIAFNLDLLAFFKYKFLFPRGDCTSLLMRLSGEPAKLTACDSLNFSMRHAHLGNLSQP